MFPLEVIAEPKPLNGSEGPIRHSDDCSNHWVRSVMLRWLPALIASLLFCSNASAQVGADLNISPKRVVFGPGDRSATVYIFNQGDQPATYSVELVDRVMLPDGQIVAAADHPQAQIASAQDLVQYTPRRITLEPRQSQAIRVRARGGGSGEHRSHLTVTALPPENAGFTVEQAASDNGDAVSLQVVALFSVSIPVIVRDGPADARALIDGLRIAGDGNQTLLSMDLVRLGASSVYGDVEIFVDDAAGRRRLTAVRGVAVYPEAERRTVTAALSEPVRAGQTVTVIYRDDDARVGEVLASATLVAP